MTQQALLADIRQVSVHRNGTTLLHSLDWQLYQHEQWGIIGPSGSGKTTLAQALAGRIFHHGEIDFYFQQPGGVLLIEQQHHFKNRSNTADLYYQQRYNSMDAEDTITVAEALAGYTTDEALFNSRMALLHLNALLDKPLIQLSNGENKRLQLAKALLQHPAMLILDNPFTGLDIEGRKTLHAILQSLRAEGIPVILIAPIDELPDSITHVMVLQEGKCVYAGPKNSLPPTIKESNTYSITDYTARLAGIPAQREDDFACAVKMKNVTVRYGAKIILQDIHWEVKRGECWSIAGPNGSGKSTLLSLITADNPQAYANDIWLFDRKRGTGESIWDIKRKIGFVSPELHLFFDAGATCFEVVASGLFDTIGLFRQLSQAQQQQVHAWLELLDLKKWQTSFLNRLSLGQQRMTLLARALVKNPPLLILDEPCQGLDDGQTRNFRELVNQLCVHFRTTLLYVSHYEKDIPACVQHQLRLEAGKGIIRK